MFTKAFSSGSQRKSVFTPSSSKSVDQMLPTTSSGVTNEAQVICSFLGRGTELSLMEPYEPDRISVEHERSG